MRVARVLFAVVAVIGCKTASKESAEPAATAGAPPQAERAPADQVKQAPAEGAQSNSAAPPPPPPGGGTVTRGLDERPREKGSAGLEAARNAGMLGPADQRAFQADGKVTIKKFSSKDLDAFVRTKLEALHTCYTNALEFHETLTGEITITVKDGKPKISGTTLKHADLEKCVVDTLTDATLPKAKATIVLAFKRS